MLRYLLVYLLLLLSFEAFAEGIMSEFKFEINSINDELRKKMIGTTWHEGCPVEIDELRHLKISYIGYDDKKHMGEMIVNYRLAEEVVDIFRELFDGGFPIEKMKIQSDYAGNDFHSMSDNNTSAFNCRKVPGASRWSKHSYGVAIDISPVINPWIENGTVLPPEGRPYLNRDRRVKGLIIRDDVCHKAFAKRGWRWGGDFRSGQDYQHFDKMY
jgi:hypothetical protein